MILCSHIKNPWDLNTFYSILPPHSKMKSLPYYSNLIALLIGQRTRPIYITSTVISQERSVSSRMVSNTMITWIQRISDLEVMDLSMIKVSLLVYFTQRKVSSRISSSYSFQSWGKRASKLAMLCLANQSLLLESLPTIKCGWSVDISSIILDMRGSSRTRLNTISVSRKDSWFGQTTIHTLYTPILFYSVSL